MGQLPRAPSVDSQLVACFRLASDLANIYSTVMASNLLLVDEMMRAGRATLKTDT